MISGEKETKLVFAADTKGVLSPLHLQKSPLWDHLLIGTLAIAAFSCRGLDWPLPKQSAVYLYSAQQLVAGTAPYESIVDSKTPLTSFVTALGVLLANAFSADDVLGVRLLYVVISTLALFTTYALAMRVYKTRAVANLSAIFYLSLPGYMQQVLVGPGPKVLLLLFLTQSLICIWDRRWFSLGISGALCALTWQPACLVIVVAALFALMQKSDPVADAISRLVLGILIPTTLVATYFILKGALFEFIQGAFVFHAFIDRPPQNSLVAMWLSLFPGFSTMAAGVTFGFVFFLLYALVEIIKMRTAPSQSGSRLMPMAAVAMLFLLYSAIDYGHYFDFVVLLPFAALGFSHLVYAALQGVVEQAALEQHLGKLILVPYFLLLVICIPPSYFNPQESRRDGEIHSQRAVCEEVLATTLGGYDATKKVIVLDLPEFAALTRIKNGTRYAINSLGMRRYIARHHADGFQGWVNSLRETNPELVVMKKGFIAAHSKEQSAMLQQWLTSGQLMRGPQNGNIVTWVKRTNESPPNNPS